MLIQSKSLELRWKQTFKLVNPMQADFLFASLNPKK